MVQREGLVDKLVVRADGRGQVGHAGSALLVGVADRIGLSGALSVAVAATRRRRWAHDPGVVLRDLAVVLADGGECLADLGTLRDQLDLFGGVASDSTAFGVIDSIDSECLDRLRGAVGLARGRAWGLGARPQRRGEREGCELTVIDVDATLTTAHSEKELAAGNFKGGFGHHPLLCYLDGTGEAPAGILRPGNAGSNTAEDHKRVLDLALAQLDPQALDGEILVRADGAGATHGLCLYCREANLRFSFGFDLDERVRQAICQMPESAWVRAIRPDGSERRDSWVAEITDHVDLSSWPEGSRLIARRTKLKAGRPAVLRRPRWLQAGGVHHRPARPGYPQARSDPPRPRARGGPHPQVKGPRALKPPVPKLSAQPGVAVAFAAGPGPARLGQAAVPGR
jgi:hypothetical protein